MSSAGGQLRPAAEVMLQPEELQEFRSGTTDEESWTRRLDRLPFPAARGKGEGKGRDDRRAVEADELCGITDAIRSDTSDILDETIPLIKGKVMEMNHV